MGKLTESANQLISSIALRDYSLYDQEIMKHGGAMKQFKDAMLNNGFHFSYLHETLQYMPREKKTIVPIVMKCFPETDSVQDRKELLRWLYFKGLYDAVPMLIDEFIQNPLNGDILYRWAVADTIYKMKCPLYASEYMAIVQNREYGIARQMIVLLLGSIKCYESIPLLLSYISDEDITLQTVSALGKIGNTECIPCLEAYATSKNHAIRKETLNAIDRIHKRKR